MIAATRRSGKIMKMKNLIDSLKLYFNFFSVLMLKKLVPNFIPSAIENKTAGSSNIP